MIAFGNDILGNILNWQKSQLHPYNYSEEGLNGSSTSTPSQNSPSTLTSNDLGGKTTTSSQSVPLYAIPNKLKQKIRNCDSAPI